ncbi:type III secretion system chaperone, partial [Desulfovibrio sp. OttesenSCG-928-M16]|nr:type III secretion system chaperone [Desulfovibrio sp. OttesenSCG-928-M16]
MNPDQLFEAYSQAHNIKLTLDGAGAARLAFDQACAVDIQYRREEETLILQSSLTLPPTAEPRLIRALLAANLFAGPDNP